MGAQAHAVGLHPFCPLFGVIRNSEERTSAPDLGSPEGSAGRRGQAAVPTAAELDRFSCAFSKCPADLVTSEMCFFGTRLEASRGRFVFGKCVFLVCCVAVP